MPCLILTIGLPGAGKTTWAYKYMLENPLTKIISTDEVRLQLTGSTDCIACMNPLIYAEARRQAQLFLYAGYDVIIDSTNVTSEDWLSYEQICTPDTIFIAKLFFIPPSNCFEQIARRERKVPLAILEMKWKHLLHNYRFLPFFFDIII